MKKVFSVLFVAAAAIALSCAGNSGQKPADVVEEEVVIVEEVDSAACQCADSCACEGECACEKAAVAE